MADVLTPRRKGLELFASPRRAKPLGVRGKRAEALTKLAIESVQDLLQHYPRRHIDRTQLRTIRELGRLARDGDLGEVTVHARVARINRPFRTRNGKRLIKGRIADETGSIDVTWFNQDWVARALAPGTQCFFYGRLSTYRGHLQMIAPRFEVVRSGREPFNVGRIIPIYPATAELSSDQIRRLMWENLTDAAPIADPLPEELRTRLEMMTREEAIRAI